MNAFHEELGEIYYYKGMSRNWAMENFHYHETYEIIVILSGGITVDVNHSTFRTSYGDLILFSSLEPHRVNATGEKEYTRYVVMFNPQVIRDMFAALSSGVLQLFETVSSGSSVRRINLSGDALCGVVKLLDRIDPYYSTRNQPESYAMVYLLIAELLLTVKELYAFFDASSEKIAAETIEDAEVAFRLMDDDKARIQQIKQYICDHVESKLNLNSIANHFFMNKYYLSHYFKKSTGFSIIQYVSMQKINRAKEMLKSGYSIRAIALTLNYSSDSHFISTFQKHVGKTPKKYIKDVANGKNQ